MSPNAAAQLTAEHEALIQFLYLAPVGLVQAGADGDIVMINPISAQLLMPLSRDGSLANLFTVLEGVAPELRLLCAAFDRPRGMVCDGLHIHLHAGERGKQAPQILSFSLMKLDNARFMAVLTDVTVQVKRERQLRQNDAWLNAILTGISDYALVGLDRRGRICEWNPSIGRVTRFSEEIVGEPYAIFYPPGAMTAEHLHDRLREADENGWSLDEGWRVREDDTRYWGSSMIAPLPEFEPAADDGERQSAYCLILRDITDKREASEERRKAAFCDHLTGLSNRRAFFEAAELELARSRHAPRPTALILIDVDRFKGINDGFGHAGGDAALRHLSLALKATFREADVVARIGGEEFAVLMPSTDGPGAAAVAERLRWQVEAQSVLVEGKLVRYTISLGVAAMDEAVPGIDALLRRADQALYAAKDGGRNRVVRWTPACPPHRNQLA
jgi:diguanylate cyclase (GGDEF)-like protein